MSADLLDEIGTLVAAACETPDRGTRSVYLAEARIRLEAARRRLHRQDMLVTAQEAELARVAKAEAAP